MNLNHTFFVYILLCCDGSYYTGMTNDVDRRVEEHNMRHDPKCYTASRLPLVLQYFEEYQYVNDAIRREKQIKGWNRKKKRALIRGDINELVRLASIRYCVARGEGSSTSSPL